MRSRINADGTLRCRNWSTVELRRCAMQTGRKERCDTFAVTSDRVR